jgi:signal transduction histidine kinase
VQTEAIDFDHRLVAVAGSSTLNAWPAQVLTSQPLTTPVGRTSRGERPSARSATHEVAVASRYNTMMEERTRVAREIHDTLLQGFAGSRSWSRGCP